MRRPLFAHGHWHCPGASCFELTKWSTTARPVPLTRDEMKRMLEELKGRTIRIPLPELTEADRAALGERADSYEARLRHHYLPAGEGSVFGGRPQPRLSMSPARAAA